MSEFAGEFVWYELMTTDLDAATRFYTEVVGWTSRDSGMQGPRYLIWSAGETMVAGAAALSEHQVPEGVPPHWVGYVAVDDVDAKAEQVKALGGQVAFGPMDIPGVGRFASVLDPHGAGFSLFKPNPPEGGFPEPPPQGAPGLVGWRELMAGDWQEAWGFYEALFGWKKDQAMEMGPAGTYQTFRSPNGAVWMGGMMTKMPEMPRPYWGYYFNVDSAKAAAGRIKAAGGEVLMAPQQVPGGSWIVNGRDPQGAFFNVMSASE